MFHTLQTTTASTKIVKLYHLVTDEFDLMRFYMVNKYKSISDFGPKKIILKVTSEPIMSGNGVLCLKY